MIKKSNLEKLLKELFENENAGTSETKYFSIEAGAEPNIQEQEMDADAAEDEAEEIEDSLHVNKGPIRQAQSLFGQEFLNEDSRGGIAQQKYICSLLRNSGRYPNWTFTSNKAGEQIPDIVIDNNKGIQSFVEVKAREGGLVAIYDKTVRLDSYEITEFDGLARALAIHNNVKIYENTKGTVKEVDIYSLKPGSVFQALLTRGTFDPSGKPSCGRYGQLTADPEAIKTLSNQAHPFKPNVFCSHKPAGFSVEHPDTGKIVMAFIPRGTGDNLEINKKIYFYNTKKKIYSEIDVKGKEADTDWVVVGGKTYLAPDGSVRPAADAGTVSSKCFSYKRSATKNEMNDSSDAVVKSALNTILQHWKGHGGGGDDYFMIVSGQDVYPYRIPNKPNILKLPIPMFDSNVINSVSLTTYGKGGVNAIRLALKCDIAMATTLQSILKK